MSAHESRRLPLIDLLKVIASQLVVLHHLAFYGPMSDHAVPLMPGLIHWLADPARMVVQVFLVVGGYLAALSLASAHAYSRRLAPVRSLPASGAAADAGPAARDRCCSDRTQLDGSPVGAGRTACDATGLAPAAGAGPGG
jgi:hypothetical protein